MSGERQSKWLEHFEGISAVCFDAFDTLVEIEDRRAAFRPLIKALPARQRAAFLRRVMREERDLNSWPTALGVHVDQGVMSEVCSRVAAEVASVRLCTGAAALLTTAREYGLSIAVCSNLASPYVPSLRRCLSAMVDFEVLSCQVGVIKPEEGIYEAVETILGTERNRVLFVGNSEQADIAGPRAYGFKAEHIGRILAWEKRDGR